MAKEVKGKYIFYRDAINKMRKQSALTLVEVLISVVISAVLLESIYMILFLGQKSWNDYSANILPRQEARHGLISMVSELREAKNPLIVTDEHSVRINFERQLVGAVSYLWSDTGEEAGKIIRINNERQRVLAKNISSLSFVSPVDTQIDIALGAGKKNDFILKEQVAIRNKTSLFLKGQNEAIK
jgi:hypothetical protein